MKRFLLPAIFAAIFATVAVAQYSGPKTVYILPMAGGLDQYLAQELTQGHVMQVVADPKAAEVIMTDRLGEAFEQKVRELRPTGDKKTDDNSTHNTFRSTNVRGTIFLVDAKTLAVLWSDYLKLPPSNSNRDLDRAAKKIAHALSPATPGSGK
jgi:hypothetical protein